MSTLPQTQVVAFRLSRHHLTDRTPLKSLAEVVSDVCGVQAQLMSAAELALWARVNGLTKEDVAHALWSERSLVKTWCMRGAAHLLSSVDLPIYIGGLLHRGLRREREWIAKYGISEAEMDAMVGAIVEALGDEILTRKELVRHVVARLGVKAKRWVEHSWGGIVKQASLQGLVVFGPNRGQEITFVRRDKWLPQVKDLLVEEAEAMLLRRYLHGYGPAGLADFAAWSGMTVGEAVQIKERINADIVEVKIGDKTGLMLRDDLGKLQEAKAVENSVRLLPNFDCFMLGHKDKSHLVDKAYYKRIYRKAGWLSPVVLVNGRAEGIWTYKKKGKRLLIAVETFHKISKNVRRLIEEETENLAHFYNTPCEVAFTT
ncbi:MAG: winged helix DNA-binding domain-containing protein [Candidatus Bathyarchaeota archaeon]|nr:winged helix DNA-binding domain-containing protein [Candidatus Bathyarchaeota archaeon]MDH5787684.1 winged helix DNA-binding domain-containing protein [Candidatus Bathyarchaeota archaeon]